jgi:hypothetical protein
MTTSVASGPEHLRVEFEQLPILFTAEEGR